jgi:hypothetical protein
MTIEVSHDRVVTELELVASASLSVPLTVEICFTIATITAE